MSELAWQMRNASKTEFVFMRNGKKMRTLFSIVSECDR